MYKYAHPPSSNHILLCEDFFVFSQLVIFGK